MVFYVKDVAELESSGQNRAAGRMGVAGLSFTGDLSHYLLPLRKCPRFAVKIAVPAKSAGHQLLNK